MNIDVSVPGGNKAFNVRKVNLTNGQTAVVSIDAEGAIDWYSNNDPVLTIDADGNNRNVTANAAGAAKILFIDGSGAIVDSLIVNVI